LIEGCNDVTKISLDKDHVIVTDRSGAVIEIDAIVIEIFLDGQQRNDYSTNESSV